MGGAELKDNSTHIANKFLALDVMGSNSALAGVVQIGPNVHRSHSVSTDR